MAVNIGLVRNVLFSVIMLIILYQVLADTATDIGNASDDIIVQNETYPLTSFFKKKGIVLLALMAGIVIVAITAFMGGKK